MYSMGGENDMHIKEYYLENCSGKFNVGSRIFYLRLRDISESFQIERDFLDKVASECKGEIRITIKTISDAHQKKRVYIRAEAISQKERYIEMRIL